MRQQAINSLGETVPWKLAFVDNSIQDVIDHFNRDWMGIGGQSWFGPEAGQALYKAYVHALQTAGDRQIKGIWIDREEVSVQVMEDDYLVLVILGAPTDRGTPCDEPCGTVFKPDPDGFV